ncbi:gluconate 5-dehydrogenase [Rahnella sp. AA]|uniref:sugar dehydrogenase complex small subunit n=1 Tax=Rahnella sp. AA TaxID=2057180 RepID=UPI000C3409CA|nr:sugar dehydrogenase complex small subunit [Rahnella sp. AA]PKE27950.1 gluconate 5-dehydrogenase [Rahnella sp. AA]
MINLSRRRMVIGTASVLAAGISSQMLGGGVFATLAHAAPPLASAITMPDSFMTLSKQLTATDNLEPHLGQALYSWLHDKQLDTRLDALSALLSAHDGVVGDNLHQLLTQQPAELAQLYQQLVSGWYLGVVGQPGSQKCIGFENIVSYQLLKNNLLPPSYAPGEPNFWVNKPATTQQNLPEVTHG